jgi:Tfp pilus assembly protein FimT
MFANQRLSNTARTLSSAFSYARGEAIRTGNVHLVLLGVDVDGVPLTTTGGDPIDVLVVDDGRLASTDQNCRLDAGETRTRFMFEDDATWGVSQAAGVVGTDTGSTTITNGSTFLDAADNAARWVLFRAEGPAHAFSADCTMKGVGSGGGAVYLTNGQRDVAVVLAPLGTTRLHGWGNGGWTD